MQGQMKKIFVLSMILGFLMLNGMIQTGYAQKVEPPSQPTNFSGLIKGFIQDLNQSVSSLAADLGFDYQQRSVIGILVSDFCNPVGEEIEIGNQIASELRAALDQGNQFHVYGKEHPTSQSLKAGLSADPKWSTSAQRNFQQILFKKFYMFHVDLIITGQVSPEPGNRIKVTANLIPFYKPISLVESEKGRTDIRIEQFLSPVLSSEEMDKGLSVIQIPTVAKGRLVVVGLIKMEKDKYSGRGTLLPPDRTTTKSFWDSFETVPRPLSWSDINCWLDDKELSVIDLGDFKKKEYHDILSGFGADTIWFDDMITEGPHSIFISLAQPPSKNRFKTFSKSFSIKGGTSNYLFFAIYSDPMGEPEVRVLRHILDPENKSTPF